MWARWPARWLVRSRRSCRDADAYDVALRDAVTVLSVPAGRFQTLTRSPVVSSVSAPAVPLTVACPDDDPLCGVAGGETVVVFDDEGHFDLFAVPSSRSTGIDVLRSDPPPHAYGPGAAVATVDLHTYYFDPNRRQLRHYDGRLTDVAVVDDVVALAFEYFGDPAPPAAPKPPAGVANCLYDATGAPIGGLPILPTDGDSLASLPLAMFRDGPWCGSGSQRFDVDLLRIRQVRVHLRVQAAPTLLRAAGPAYAAAGTSRDARLTAPDYALQFDVSPRNLNFDR
jgi:hypothetical protein